MGKKDKKAYQAFLKAHGEGKGSSGNSFLSINTNKSKKEVKKRVEEVRKSTPKKSGSQGYKEYQKIHSGNGSSGYSFLSTNTNKSKKEVKKRVKEVRKSHLLLLHSVIVMKHGKRRRTVTLTGSVRLLLVPEILFWQQGKPQNIIPKSVRDSSLSRKREERVFRR